MIKFRTSALVCLILCSFTSLAYSFTASVFSRSTSCSSTYSPFVSKRRGTGCSRKLVDDRFSLKTVVRFRRQVLRATIPTDLKGKERLEKFLADCVLMGPVRFVCMTDAAVLEAVGSFDNLRYNDIPKGRYATVSEGRSFECHLNTDKIKAINMVMKRSKDDDFDLYITRFLDEKGDTLLSAMLHNTDGVYEPGATDYWQKLRKSFGAEQTIE